MKERPGFMLYFDVVNALSSMADAEAGQLFKALMAYARYGEVQELTGMAAFAFELVRGRIDRDAEAYAEKCRKNAYAAYVREAQRRGEMPLEYEVWCSSPSDDIKRYPTTTTAAIPAAIANTVPNRKTNTNVFSKTDKGNAPPPLNDDTSWVDAFLEERKQQRQGGAACRKHTGS